MLVHVLKLPTIEITWQLCSHTFYITTQTLIIVA